uniref:uncharacterized protein LOC120333159 isoform X1 n=1 Tax=Styela clava TaxID=7725 RepID=UPI0019397069|nr:uncharacterized protein LOC120333159 isoform X1 [Styela clava]
MGNANKAAFVPANDVSNEERIGHPEGDVLTKGDVREMMDEMRTLSNKVENLEMEKADMAERIARCERVCKENEELKRKLNKIMSERAKDAEKLKNLEKIAESHENLLREHEALKKKYDKALKENEKMRKKLEESGVKKTNWWKVGALIGIAVVLGVATGGLAAFGIFGFVVAKIAIGCLFGGGVVAAIGGGAIAAKWEEFCDW